MPEPKLIEYQEVLAERRHYDVLRWTVTGLVYPTAFAVIAFAGNKWGFASGRAFFVEALGIIWLVAGSLVYAQCHFYGNVRMHRAWELEEELGFRNLSHRQFKRPKESEQPHCTKGLSKLFTTHIPFVALLGALLWGILVVGRLFSSPGVNTDAVGVVIGLGLLLVAFVYFFMVCDCMKQ